MTKRISELPAAGAIADTDELEIAQSGVSRKATRGQIVAGLASASHQHGLVDIADAGALAALDIVGTAEIDPTAYTSQAEAAAGTDNAKVMTALRTSEAIAAQAAAPTHQHSLSDITDAGALAALDAIRPTEIDPSVYATQIDAAEGVDGTRVMTAVRTAEAIAVQAAPQEHQHSVADITDAGALAALDIVGTAQIAPAAYASQSEAVAGADNAKLMTALRAAQAIAAQAAAPTHQHGIADITDAGALADLDAVGTAQIEATAYASQSEAVAGTDENKLMTPLRTAEAIAAQPPGGEHQHTLADITDAGALAALDAIRPTEIDPSTYATQIDAAEGADGTRIMTAVRTAEAIAAQAAPLDHQHSIADITDAGTLAALDTVGAGEIGPNAVTSGKILSSAVTTAKLANGAATQDKIADGAVSADKLASSAVTSAKLADAAVTQAKIADGAVGVSKLQPGIPIDMQDAVLRAPELRDYAETSPAPSINSETLTLDLETGNVFDVTLTENVTSLVLAHAPATGRAASCTLILRQDFDRRAYSCLARFDKMGRR